MMQSFLDKDFGLALGTLGMGLNGVRDYADFPVFSAIEFPLEMFTTDHAELFRRIPHDKYHEVHCSGIMDRDLSGTIAFAPRNLQNDFADQAVQILDQICAGNCFTATLECDMDQIFNDSEARDSLIYLLHRMTPALLKNKMTLLLPFRLPTYSPERSGMMNKFLRDSMIPGLKLRLDIHPFDIEPGTTPDELIGPLFREVRSIMLHYDADCGSRISAKIIRSWAEIFDVYDFSGPFFLAPYSQRHRMVYPQAESFAKIVSDLRNG